ncbi:MAG TPA: DVUA0089 family protein [Allocoleopsis sp.]
MAQDSRSWGWNFGLAGFLLIGGAITLTGCFAIAFSGSPALAQITPDGSLGAETSVVTPNVSIGGLPADRIDGGATRGANLFHSFLEFNVGNGQRVYFANPTGIENILSRVTGNNLSNIFGTLGVNGGANLFLLNPNGIIFGPNAKLDIGGSFVASTADSVVFDNGFAFSATNPQAPPLLTISVPIGLQFGSKAGAIRVQASLSPGEPFTEIGDAGQLPATAQAANTQPSGTALSSISGRLSNQNDVDLFQIFLTGNQTFSATTVGSTGSDFGGKLDTQLFLFNQDGTGIYVSNDVANGVESYLPSGRPLTPAEPGLYYLGVSSFNNNPSSTAGAMFFPTFSGSESGPYQPKLPLSNWSNTGADSGSYTIHLTGAHFNYYVCAWISGTTW